MRQEPQSLASGLGVSMAIPCILTLSTLLTEVRHPLGKKIATTHSRN